MEDTRQQWKRLIHEAVIELARVESLEAPSVSVDDIVVENPPKPELGDLAFPMFPFARAFRSAPNVVAAKVKGLLESRPDISEYGAASVVGAYLNVRVSMAPEVRRIIGRIEREGEGYGRNDSLAGKRIMVEFSCPNTNKPLHLGHLRNDAIGMSVSAILDRCGADVRKVLLINDRGIHICKSMLAYRRFGEGRTPESEGIKSDHFVGDYYVRYATWERSDAAAEPQARELLRKWEADDPETTKLWKTMNEWAISGIQQTYDRTGVSFDDVYYESSTYQHGRKQVLDGLERGIFYRDADNSVRVDLTDIGLDKKVLLRSDGTSVYITQDIGTAILRHDDWPFDRLIYVVAAEQDYHFVVLFAVLKKLGYEWAQDLHHLSYGMVNLPEGKMKSREGTVVDADDLLDELEELAKQEIRDKDRVSEIDDMEDTARKIALAAVGYFMLQVSPTKDMVFNPAESIAFNGNTGPYLQYTGARISSMLRKYEERRGQFAGGRVDASLVQAGDEWELVKLLGQFPDRIAAAARDLNPTAIATYLFDVARTYSRYYHDNPVLHNEDRNLVVTRIAVARAVQQVLRNGFALIGVPFLDRM